MVDVGGNKQRLFDWLFRRGESDRFLRHEDQCYSHRHMLAAAQARVARALSVVFIRSRGQMRRNVAIVGRQQVAGKDFHRYKEQQKQRRTTERL